jgi:hypothetical protein
MLQYFETLTDDSGNALLGATCQVFSYPVGTPAPIYNSNGTASPVANNTIASDITGQISFYVPDGDYTLVYAYQGTTYKTKSPVQMFDPMGLVSVADVGTVNAYVLTDARLPATLYAGQKVEFLAANTNTGASTLNVNSTGAQALNFPGGDELSAGVVQARGLYRAEWDGSEWQLFSVQSQSFYATTPAEQAAGVTPVAFSFQEGDIRRYGALAAANDNHAAVNAALLVSGFGGAAAFIPGGTWKCTQAVTVAQQSSMYGVGNGSILQFNSVDGLQFALGTNSYATVGLSRFFRDFQIYGTNSAVSSNHGIYINFPQSDPTAVIGIDFRNINISGFQWGVYARGLWYSQFTLCETWDCYFGFYFIGNNIANSLINCFASGQNLASVSGSVGLTIDTIAGETTQDFKAIGLQTYNFDIGINAPLSFDVKITNAGLANCQSIGIQVTATIEGFTVRDCWINLNAATPAAVIGISIPNIQPSASAKVIIEGNTFVNGAPFAGSTAVSVGNASNGIVIDKNTSVGFDRGLTAGNNTGLCCRHNTLGVVTSAYNASSYAIQINSSASGNEIGPNYIVPGTAVAATMGSSSANITVPAASAFPVNSPVQFDATQNGFTVGVTYFVITSSGTTITVGASAGASAITATGNTAVNIFQAPLPITFNTSTTPPGLKLFARGASILTLSDPAVSAPVSWAANGGEVTIAPQSILTGSGGTTTMTATGLPIFLFPPTQQGFNAAVENNSTVSGAGYGVATVGGTLAFYPTPAAGVWTASGTKALYTQAMSWPYL